MASNIQGGWKNGRFNGQESLSVQIAGLFKRASGRMTNLFVSSVHLSTALERHPLHLHHSRPPPDRREPLIVTHQRRNTPNWDLSRAPKSLASTC